jgi:hypothetical protein
MKRLFTLLALGLALMLATISAATPGDSWDSNTAVLAADVTDIQAVTFDSKIVYLGGEDLNQKVFSSIDGVTWIEEGTDELTAPIYQYGLVAWNGNLYSIGGRGFSSGSDQVISSAGTDLTNWTFEGSLSGPRFNHCSLVAGSNLLAIGGQSNISGDFIDLVEASDGTDVSTWSTIGNLPVAIREMACTLYNGTIYIIGGRIASGVVRTVYSSSDAGVTWSEVGSNAFPVALSQARAIVYDNAIYVLGGSDASFDELATVYRSSDGLNWVEVGSDVLPEALSYFGLTAFEGRLWVIGGTGADNTARDDVHFTESIVGNSLNPTPLPADLDRIDVGSTVDQSGDIADADLPFGDFIQIAATDSGFPIRFFWVVIAMTCIIFTGLLLAKASPDNLFLPAIGVIVMAGIWAVVGQGIIPLWLHLSLAMVALAAVFTGRSLFSN